MAFLTFLVNKHPTPPAPISGGQPFPTVSLELPFASHDGITTLLDTLTLMNFSTGRLMPQKRSHKGLWSREVLCLPIAGPFA